jgi:hypothetical protein
MTRYTVYGAGTPIEVETYHPEIAEAIVIEWCGCKIENIKAVRETDVVLPRDSNS